MEFGNLYILFLAGNWVVFIVCLSVEKNAVMPDNYRFMMDFEYQEKQEENLRTEIKSLRNLYNIY
jgi:hypothetical protein